jgi:hypothetical protein
MPIGFHYSATDVHFGGATARGELAARYDRARKEQAWRTELRDYRARYHASDDGAAADAGWDKIADDPLQWRADSGYGRCGHWPRRRRARRLFGISRRIHQRPDQEHCRRLIERLPDFKDLPTVAELPH